MAKRETFDFKRLMTKAGSPTAEAMAVICGLNRKGVHNRMNRGVGWIEADEFAVRCGFLPWEVWPEWLEITLAGRERASMHGDDLAENLGGQDSSSVVALAA
jgi:hypothetical protein